MEWCVGWRRDGWERRAAQWRHFCASSGDKLDCIAIRERVVIPTTMATEKSRPRAISNSSATDSGRIESPLSPKNSTGSKAFRLVIIDDDTLLARALGAWLRRDARLEVLGSAASGNQGWELCLAARPDLALVDFQMPDGDGFTLVKRLRLELPAIRVIMLTGRVDPHTAWRAAECGVHGLIDKTIEPSELTKIIHLIALGGEYHSPGFQKIRQDWLRRPEAFQKRLTNRELTVLHQLTEGATDEAIGETLGISAQTVACHRKSLRRKLNVHDDRGLMAYGRDWGIFGAGR